MSSKRSKANEDVLILVADVPEAWLACDLRFLMAGARSSDESYRIM